MLETLSGLDPNDIANVWIVSSWCSFHRQRPGKFRNLLDLVEVSEGQGERQLSCEGAGRGVVGQAGSDRCVCDSERDRRLAGSRRRRGNSLGRRRP